MNKIFRLFLVIITLLPFIDCFSTNPIILTTQQKSIYQCMRFCEIQDSIKNIENELLLKNAGNELIKAERKFYLGVSLIFVGTIIYQQGHGDKFISALGIGIGGVGAFFSIKYMNHIGNAGRILNGTNLKRGTGLHIKSDNDGLGLAFRF
ncbi:hypothetical protein ACE01N_20575 [Saccharicrinis sp. FJH2]|uniref:hypothetical protein n=1 Tax=Saccharicrinis sp. FJH65 TaxID=3344659 RepID=UPI0035F45F90